MAKILHLTDIHFGCENKPAVAVAAELAHRDGHNLIVISGDITQFGRNDEFRAAKAWVDTLPGPVLITPGNHDTPYSNIPARLAAPFARYERYFGPAWSGAFDGAGMRVRSFNSSRGAQVRLNWSKGAVSRDHIERVAETLKAAEPGIVTIAVCHHPLMEMLGGPMTGNVRGGPEAAGILADADVDLVLTGHIHSAFAMSLPCDDGLTHAVGASTLSLRERGMAAGFNLIDWDEETITVVAQGWTGSHYEPLRTWALPRRKRQRPCVTASGGGDPASSSPR